jgi:uncharacterized protein HemY
MSLRHIVALLALLAAACATPPTAEKPAPVTPQITEDVLRARASEQLLTGIRQYEAGEYDSAVKTLGSSLEHGMLSKTDQ